MTTTRFELTPNRQKVSRFPTEPPGRPQRVTTIHSHCSTPTNRSRTDKSLDMYCLISHKSGRALNQREKVSRLPTEPSGRPQRVTTIHSHCSTPTNRSRTDTSLDVYCLASHKSGRALNQREKVSRLPTEPPGRPQRVTTIHSHCSTPTNRSRTDKPLDMYCLISHKSGRALNQREKVSRLPTEPSGRPQRVTTIHSHCSTPTNRSRTDTSLDVYCSTSHKSGRALNQREKVSRLPTEPPGRPQRVTTIHSHCSTPTNRSRTEKSLDMYCLISHKSGRALNPVVLRREKT